MGGNDFNLNDIKRNQLLLTEAFNSAAKNLAASGQYAIAISLIVLGLESIGTYYIYKKTSCSTCCKRDIRNHIKKLIAVGYSQKGAENLNKMKKNGFYYQSAAAAITQKYDELLETLDKKAQILKEK